MPRAGFIFIAICMVLIAVSASALVVSVAGASLAQASVVGLSLLLMMVIGHLASQRQRDRDEHHRLIEESYRQIETLSNDVTMLAQRIDRFETLAMDKAKLATAPIAQEIDALGGLVKQFAETLNAHESAIQNNAHQLARRDLELRLEQERYATERYAAPPVAPSPPPAPPPLPEPMMAPEPVTPLQVEPPAITTPVVALLEAIEQAASNGRMDLYLQPIVTLPQRKVRWYEAQTRLRAADGTMIEQSEWRGAAEAVGVHTFIDRQALLRSAQMVRKLVTRIRDAGLVVTLSGSSLADPAFASEIDHYLSSNPSLARSVLLQLSLHDFHDLGQAERRLMATLASKGYRFAVDMVDDLALDGSALAQKGVKLVKAPANLILAEADRVGAQKHPADIALELSKYGIELVAGDIHEEAEVLDLIDFDIPLAQGALFSTPKAVPHDMLNDEPAPASAAPVATPQNATARDILSAAKAGTLGSKGTSLGAAVLSAMGEQSPTRKSTAAISTGLKALIRGRRP